MANKNMQKAKANKNDEFYTKMEDIERELINYKDQFKDKIIYLNCDNPGFEKNLNTKISNFWKFFNKVFKDWELKKVIATHYRENEKSYKVEFDGVNTIKTNLTGDGDFRSKESIDILKEADIVCTNPPFSLYRDFVEQLFEYNKDFLIIGNFNSVSFKEIFPLIKNNKMWVGYSPRSMFFIQPDGTEKSVNACWFTNLKVDKRNKKIKLKKEFKKEQYDEYDNYKAIEVSRVSNIPKNYKGVMGVPITFLEKYNPNQFEIIGFDYDVLDKLKEDIAKKTWKGKFDRGYVKGKRKYSRIFIKHK